MTNFSFCTSLGKARETIITQPSALQDQERAHKLKKSATRGSKEHVEGISIGGLKNKRKYSNSYTKRYSKITFNREMHIKTTTKHHLTPAGMATPEKIKVLAKVCGKDSCALLVAM